MIFLHFWTEECYVLYFSYQMYIIYKKLVKKIIVHYKKYDYEFCFIPVLVQSCLLSRLRTVFVLISCLCTVFFFLSDLQICFDPISMQIRWLFRRHDYSGHLNFGISMVDFVIFVDIRPFYAINSDVVRLFVDSSFSF
jgi:hypothetical protein